MQTATTFIINTTVAATGIAPNCGGLKKEQWVEDLTADLLPTAYYHVVFTLPHQLPGLLNSNKKSSKRIL